MKQVHYNLFCTECALSIDHSASGHYNPDMEPTQIIIIVIGSVVMVAFAGGVLWNIRHGNAVMRWMQGGLPLIGEKTTLRWLGSSVVELNIEKARTPFRRFTLVLVLQPRDVPWLWLGSLLRNRRDMVIVRASLTSAPRLEYDLIAPQSWTGRSAYARALNDRWETQAMGDMQYAAPKASLSVTSQSAQGLLDTARQVDPTVWRLSVRREYPQIELHVPMPNPASRDASQFFETLRLLARQVMSE